MFCAAYAHAANRIGKRVNVENILNSLLTSRVLSHQTPHRGPPDCKWQFIETSWQFIKNDINLQVKEVYILLNNTLS
jgi:hypothetical protein